MQIDPERAKYIDPENVCQDDFEWVTHTGQYATQPLNEATPQPEEQTMIHFNYEEILELQEALSVRKHQLEQKLSLFSVGPVRNFVQRHLALTNALLEKVTQAEDGKVKQMIGNE